MSTQSRAIVPALFVRLHERAGADPAGAIEFETEFGLHRGCVAVRDPRAATAHLREGVPVLATVSPQDEVGLGAYLHAARWVGVPTTLVIGEDALDWLGGWPPGFDSVIDVGREALAGMPAKAAVRWFEHGERLARIPGDTVIWDRLDRIVAAARAEVNGELAVLHGVPGEEELRAEVVRRAATLAAAGALVLRFEEVEIGPPTGRARRVLTFEFKVMPYALTPRAATLIVVRRAWSRLFGPRSAASWLARVGSGVFTEAAERRVEVIVWTGSRRYVVQMRSTVDASEAAAELRARGIPCEAAVGVDHDVAGRDHH